MASAELKKLITEDQILVPQIKRTETVTGVRLDLTVAEAETLLRVTNRIGGIPTKSPRKYMQRISAALRQAGVVDDPDHYVIRSGDSLWFENYNSDKPADPAPEATPVATTSFVKTVSRCGQQKVAAPEQEEVNVELPRVPKVGDRIRVTEARSTFFGVGDEGTLISMEPDGSVLDSGGDYWFTPDTIKDGFEEVCIGKNTPDHYNQFVLI